MQLLFVALLHSPYRGFGKVIPEPTDPAVTELSYSIQSKTYDSAAYERSMRWLAFSHDYRADLHT